MSVPGVAELSVPTIASLLDDEPVSSGVSSIPVARRGDQGPSSAPQPEATLALRVVWGDLTTVTADIHVTGHYQGVLPASAEKALDEAISPARSAFGHTLAQRGIIAEHTRRRWLVGELGEVSYFPGRNPADGAHPAVHRVAVAGMGHLGTLNEMRAEQLYASLLRELTALADVHSAATVLIGSGAGNLTVAQAARALVRGFTEILTASRGPLELRQLTIVESDRLRAEQLNTTLKILTRESRALTVEPKVVHGRSGQVSVESAAVFALRAIAHALRRREEPEPADAEPADGVWTAFAEALPEGLEACVPEKLKNIQDDDLQALSVVVGQQPDTDGGSPPTRISVSIDARPGRAQARWAALTMRSTIPERQVPVNPGLIADLIQRLTAPNAADAARLPRMLRRWVIPEDFQNHIDDTAPLVLEVDGTAAQMPWEFLTDRLYDEQGQPLPLALRTPIARQLRTSYSRAVADYAEPSRLRALVVADPGPQDRRLPAARDEGIALTALLRERGVEVSFFVGSPGTDPPEGAEIASELDVLSELLVGRYDIVHFAGHGTLDPEQPELAGWVFSDGLLSARDLAQMTWAPRLVTANACWTASGLGMTDRPSLPYGLPSGSPGTPRTGTSGPGATGPTEEREARATLTAVLADEFLRVGVAHYIGTSWQIPDGMGEQFARSFYEQVLPTPGQPGRPFGEALRSSRQVLFAMRGSADGQQPEVTSAWAAYQHYGDPADVLDAFEEAQPSTQPPGPGPQPTS